MTTGTWEILGIEQTSDQHAIKRAYAAKLKQHKPEDDPVAFQRLRMAFEEARSMAQYLHEVEPSAQMSQSLASAEMASNLPDTPSSVVPQINIHLEQETLQPQPDSRTELSAEPVLHDVVQPLYEEARTHASYIWECLQAKHAEQEMASWLTRYLEQDWFIHMDARQFLEHALLNIAIEGDQPSIRSDVIRFVGSFFDWNANSLHRRDEAWLIRCFWYRYEFSLAWETIHAVNPDNPMLKRVVKMLKQAPRTWLFRMEALLRPKQIALFRQLFEHWDEYCPEIYKYLNDGSVSWWRQYTLDENRTLWPLFDYTGTVLAFVALVLALFTREQIQAETIMLLPLWGILFAALYGGRIAYGQFAFMTAPYRQGFWQAWSRLLQHPAAVPAVILFSLVDIGLLASLPEGVPLILLAMVSYLLPYLFLRDFKEWFGLNFLALPMLMLLSVFQPYVANPLLLLHFGGICIIAGGWYGLSRMAFAKHWSHVQLAQRIKYWNYLAMGLPFILLGFFI